MGLNETLVNHVWRNYPDNISVQNIATIFTAKEWGDVKALMPTASFPDNTPFELNTSDKTLLSSIAIELIIQNQTQNKSLIQLYDILTAKDKYPRGSEQFKSAQQDIIQNLQILGLAKEVGRYYIEEALILQARADEFEYSILKQAQSLLLKQIQELVLTDQQLQYLTQEQYQAKEFKSLFPAVDEALINFLDVDKRYHLLEVQHVQLSSSDIQKYAKEIQHQRAQVKWQIRDAIKKSVLDGSLLTLFAECKSLSENDQLTPQQRSIEIINLLKQLPLNTDENILGDILAFDPLVISREIIYKASNQVNEKLMNQLITDENIADEYLEKIITSEKTGFFSEDLLGFSMTEKGSLPISKDVQAMATTKLLNAKLNNNTSATFLAKLINEPYETVIRQLCGSEKCSDAIIKNRLLNRFNGNTLIGNISTKTKSIINQEVLSMTLSRSQIKKIIGYNESYPKNPKDLFAIVDETILHNLARGYLFSESSVQQLTERLQAQNKLIDSINEKITSETEISVLHDLYETFSVDKVELSPSASQEIKDLEHSLTLTQEKIHAAIERAAANHAEEKLKHMPGIHKQDLELRVNAGGDRSAIVDEYRKFYHQNAKGVLERYVNDSHVNLLNSNILSNVTEIKVLLTEVDAISQKIKQCRRLDLDQYMEKAKIKLGEILPDSTSKALAFVDDDELKQLALNARKVLVSKIEEQIKEALTDSYLDREQLKLILRNDVQNINVYIQAFPDIDTEVLKLSARYGKIFDEQCQMIAADFLDEKSEFEMKVLEFLKNKPSIEDLEKFLNLTDIALDGVFQINVLKEFLQEKVGCSSASANKFVLPMSQWLNHKAKYYLTEQADKVSHSSSMTRILEKLKLGVSATETNDVTHSETISTLDLDDVMPEKEFVSIEDKKTPNGSPISVESDVTDNEDISETDEVMPAPNTR